MKAMVSQYYPGLQIGCTEYNWGDEPNLNGATTQADVLGIYGREGFDLATRWTVAENTSTTPTTYYVTYLASQIYRNYDGNNSTFGDTSVEANVANPDNLSAFASVRDIRRRADRDGDQQAARQHAGNGQPGELFDRRRRPRPGRSIRPRKPRSPAWLT